MARLLNIVIYFCIAVFFLGCKPAEEEKPIWQDIKIGDLAPSKKSGGDFLLKSINFDIYIFEIPKKNIGFLEEIFLLLYTEPILFNDIAAFGANSFALGFAGMGHWDQIAELLDAAGGSKLERITLLLTDNQTENIHIKTLGSGKDIIYASSARQFETVPLGPGEIVLQIKAEKIPEARGICTLNVKPAFTAQNLRQDEYPFTPLSFTVRISPGYFLFLGPTDSVVPKDSLANLFFRKQGKATEQGKEEYIKTYLLVCTGIID